MGARGVCKPRGLSGKSLAASGSRRSREIQCNGDVWGGFGFAEPAQSLRGCTEGYKTTLSALCIL